MHKHSASKAGYSDAQSYRKPGAALRLSHDYAGLSDLNQIERLNLSLIDGYEQGQLEVELYVDAGLTYQGPMVYHFDLSSDNPHKMTLDIGTYKAGRHYLNINARLSFDDGRQAARNFAVVFDVGLAAKGNLKSDGLSAQSDSHLSGDTALILMPAVENIR